MKTGLKVLSIFGLIPVCLLLLMVIRYYSGQGKILEANTSLIKQQIDLPPVEHLVITPIIDSQAINDQFKVEDGVAYLLQTDNDSILFDVGYNKKDEKNSPLLYNLDKLNLNLKQVNSIAISHAHVDHCGGIGVVKEKKIKLTNGPFDLQGKKVFTPVPLTCDTGSVVLTNQPTLIGKDIASTGPLSVQMFATGKLVEQSLLVNLKNKGLVILIGCGHPQIETIIKAAETMTGLPVYAIVGGAHLYYTKVQDIFWRNLFGSSRLFCRSMTKPEVLETIQFTKVSGVQKVYLSPHDSDDATRALFAGIFGSHYDTIQVGKRIEF